MTARFFGDFLLERGRISEDHLHRATALMRSTNRRIGDRAVEAGYMTRAQCERIWRAQRDRDVLWGELARELGLLDREQVEGLLRDQANEQIRLGEALQRCGPFDADTMRAWIEEFEREEAEREGARLPEDFARCPLVGHVLQHLPELALRMAGVPLKLSPAATWNAHGRCPGMHALIAVRGEIDLDVGLIADDAFVDAMVQGWLGLPPGEATVELVRDVFGEFLNVVVGGAKSFAESRGIEVELGMPVHGELPGRGSAVEFAGLEGGGAAVFGRPVRPPCPPSKAR